MTLSRSAPLSKRRSVPTHSDTLLHSYLLAIRLNMRLINTDTLEFEEFEGEDIPKYAILSHTWGSDEVSFGDFQRSVNP